MRPRLLMLATGPLLAACQPAEEAVASSSQGQGTVTSVEDLVGEYRVAEADGRDINLPHGISAIINESTIRVSSDCLNFAWSYRLANAQLVTEAVPVPSCRRALLAPEEAVRAALDAAQAVRRTPANGVEFSGDGHSVTLFSQ